LVILSEGKNPTFLRSFASLRMTKMTFRNRNSIDFILPTGSGKMPLLLAGNLRAKPAPAVEHRSEVLESAGISFRRLGEPAASCCEKTSPAQENVPEKRHIHPKRKRGRRR
jgi:hypothetical protein